MAKRIFKIVGIVFGVAIVLFGAIIGIMALQGKFKKPHIEPKSLYFDLSYDQVERTYYMDVTYYANELDTKGEVKSNLNYFILRATPDNVTELDCTMQVVWGQDLIDFCDEEGNLLSNEEKSKVKINKPVYFKISSDYDYTSVGYQETRGEVKIQFYPTNNLSNADLKINIDRQVSSVSLYDFTNSQNNVHQNGKFDYEKNVYDIVTLTEAPESWEGYYIQVEDGVYMPINLDEEFENFATGTVFFKSRLNKTLNLVISANDDYALIPIYAPENSNKPFSSTDGKSCNIYIKNGGVYEDVKTTSSSYIKLGQDGNYYFNSTEPGEHELYLVTYPTYAIQQEALEYFANDNNTDNLIFNNDYAIIRKVVINVQNFGIKEVTFQSESDESNTEAFVIGLDLFKDNYFVMNKNLGGEYVNLEVSMKNNQDKVENSRLNQAKFFDISDFVQGNVSFTAKATGINTGVEIKKATIVLEGTNAILTNFGEAKVDGVRNYYISYEPANDEYKISIRDFGVDGTLSLIFKAPYVKENGLFKLQSSTTMRVESSGKLAEIVNSGEEFTCSTPNLLGKCDNGVYSIGTIKAGSYLVFTEGAYSRNNLFEISSSGYGAEKTFKVLPMTFCANLNLYMFIVNEDGSCVYTENPATVSIDPEATTFTKTEDVDDLKIKFTEIEIEGVKTGKAETSDIAISSLVNIQTGSYVLPLMFVKTSDVKVKTLPVTLYDSKGNAYRLVGYLDEDKNFVNSVKSLDNAIGLQELCVIILEYPYSIKTSEELAEYYLDLGKLRNEDKTDDVEVQIPSSDIANYNSFNLANNTISLNIKFAEQLATEEASSLKFVGSFLNSDGSIVDLSENVFIVNEGGDESKTFIYNVSIDEHSSFKYSKLLELLKGKAETDLVTMNQYFTFTINLHNENGAIVQSGVVTIVVSEGVIESFTINNSVISSYIEILSAKYKAEDNCIQFEFKTKNDPSDSFVGSVLTTGNNQIIKGYYFQFVFDYEGETAVSNKMVIRSTAVTGYSLKHNDVVYDFNEYKLVYKIVWNDGYAIQTYLRHKTDSNIDDVLLRTYDSLSSNLFDTDKCKELIVANPEYSDPNEYEFRVESNDTSILNVYSEEYAENIIISNIVKVLKAGSAQLTLYNTTKTSTNTVIEVEIVSDIELIIFNEKQEIGANSFELYTSSDSSNIKYGYYTDPENNTNFSSIFNALELVGTNISTGDNIYRPTLSFEIETLTSGYSAYKFVSGDITNNLFKSVGSENYLDYILIRDNGYKLVLSKPENWDTFNFAKANYYDSKREKITSAYKFVPVTETIDWSTVDFNTEEYYLLNTEYERITDSGQISGNTVYKKVSTWQDGQVYSRYNTVASLRLYEVGGGTYQWRLVREADYVLTSLQFNLIIDSIVGSKTVEYTYLSTIKIEKNANNDMVTNEVITYYKGTNLQLASLVGSADEKNTLFKLTDNTNSNSTSFELQIFKNNIWTNLYNEEGSGTKGTTLTLNATNTKDLSLDEEIQARIYFSEYKFYEFKFIVLENLLHQTDTNEKENTFDNAHTLTWSATSPIIELNNQISYFEYNTENTYTSYTDASTDVVENVEYSLLSGEYDGIITLDSSTLSLGWVQFAGSKTYPVTLTVISSEKTIEVVYYVKVQSNFEISSLKDLPDLKAYENITFDINEYFKIKNGAEELEITNATIDNVAKTDNNGLIVVNNYFGYDFENSNLIYSSAVGGNLLIEITFTINVNGEEKQIKALDEAGEVLKYAINVENYKLPLKEDAYLVGNGGAETLFTDLFDVDWNYLSSIEIILEDSNVNRFNNLRITEETSAENMLKLGAMASKDGSEYVATIKIKLTYKDNTVNGEVYEYDQSLTVKTEYYALIDYTFNDLVEDISSSTINKLTSEMLNLPNLMPFDIALTEEKLDLFSKFKVYKSLDNSLVEGSSLKTVQLVGAIGYTSSDCNEITINGTSVEIGTMSNVGFLIFLLSNEQATCYYMLKVTPQNISASENYTSILVEGERRVITKEHVVTESGNIEDLITSENISSSLDNSLSEDFLKDKTISYYLINVSKENTYNYEEQVINIGDKINDLTYVEPKNPTVITVAVVLTNDVKIVHLINYEITLLPNVVETAVGANNVTFTKGNNYYEYNMEISYSYTDRNLNAISLNPLFTFTDSDGGVLTKSLNKVSSTLTLNDNVSVNDETKTILLNKNISADITFDLTLTFDELEITVHVTYKKFENENITRTYVLGWNGTEFNYKLAFKDLVKNYTGSVTYTISGDTNSYSETDEYVLEFTNIPKDSSTTKILTLTLDSITGAPQYIFTVILDPSISASIDKGATEGDSVLTIKDDIGSKLDLSINKNTEYGYIETVVKNSNNTISDPLDDTIYATIRVKDSSKLSYNFVSVDGKDMNTFIAGSREITNLSTSNSIIEFIPSASNFSGKLVLTVDGYKNIEIYVIVSKTFEATVQYPISVEDSESFAVGDNLTIKEFIDGARYEYEAINTSENWTENTYYYFDNSTNKHLLVDTSYLFNKYRSSLRKGSEKVGLANSDVYNSTTTYYYLSSSNVETELSNTEGQTNYIFFYLFNLDKEDYFIRVSRPSEDLSKIDRYVPVINSDEWKEDTYYIYDSEKLEYSLIKDNALFQSTPINQMYKIQTITLNNKRIVPEEILTHLTTPDTLNTLQVEVYYNSATGWTLDSNKVYATVENETIHFTQAGNIRLRLYNDTGLELLYHIDIKENEYYEDNIIINSEIGGIETVDEDKIQYVAVTLSQLQNGYKLASLTYSPSDENMFALYAVDATSCIGLNTGIIDGSGKVKLTYQFKNNVDLTIYTNATSFTGDKVCYDLYLITKNGIVKTVRLYITNIVIQPLETLTILANTEGTKLSENGLKITNGGNEISYNNSGDYTLTYTGALNQTDGVYYTTSNTSLVYVQNLNSDVFSLGGVEKEKHITLYYDLKHNGILIQKIEYKIIVQNNIVIGGGGGFEEYDSSMNGTVYLNNYTYSDNHFEVDLMTKTDGVNNYRNEYITYQDLSKLTPVYLDGDHKNVNLSLVSSYLNFEILEDSYGDSVIGTDGVLKIKHDKNGTVKIKVTAKYSPNYYKIFVLNIKSTIDVYSLVPENEYHDNGYVSGESEVTLATLKYLSTNAMFSFSQYKTDSNYEVVRSEINKIDKVSYSYALGFTGELSYVELGEVELSPSNNITHIVPSVPMDGVSHYVTYKIKFTVSGTDQEYKVTLKVSNPVNLAISDNYTSRAITVGQNASQGSNLYLYSQTEGQSLFKSSNTIMNSPNKIKLNITDDGTGNKKEVFFDINSDGTNYYITLSAGKDESDNTVSILFSNSMSFDLVFVDSNNSILYTLSGWTMTATNSMTPTLNKALTDIFTVSELGAELATKKFSAVTSSTSVSASTFGLSGTLSASTPKTTITRTVGVNTYTYYIYSVVVQGSSNVFYNNNLTVYYVVSSNDYFIELATGYYIAEIIKNVDSDYTIDLTESLKVFKVSTNESITVSTNVELIGSTAGITPGSGNITISQSFLENLKNSGETTYSFDIMVNYGGGNYRLFPVRLTLDLSNAN